MTISETFDQWATEGRDEAMEERHWHTAKIALEMLPVEPSETVLDLGTGSGYALRALRERGIRRGYGIDASPEMIANAAAATDAPNIAYLLADFETLPFESNAIDHAFSMEAIYYADIAGALSELQRVLRPGGTFYCAVDYYEENPHTRGWDEFIEVPMARLSRAEYRELFEAAGFHVAAQHNIPDRDIEIPPAGEFPTDSFDTRTEMIEHYRTYGTLLTVGVAQ